MERTEYCKFNKTIDCEGKANCHQCGWNPAVKLERMREIHRIRSYGLSATPSRCPFCGRVPMVNSTSLGFIIRCATPDCKIASTGYRSSPARAIVLWERRVGVRKADSV